MVASAPSAAVGPRWVPAAIFLLALVPRLYAVLRFPTAPTADAAIYHAIATNLVQGHGFANAHGQLTAIVPPVYPLFLAAIYAVCGPHPVAAGIVQAILGGVTVLLIIALGQLLIGPREGLIAGALAAIYPGLFWIPRLLLSENLALPLLLAALYAAAWLLRHPQPRWALALGVLLSIGTLARGATLFVAVFIIAGLLWSRYRYRFATPRQGYALIALVVVALGLVLTPWPIRNEIVFHHFVPLQTQDGITLYSSYWPPRRKGRLIWGSLPNTSDPVIAAAFSHPNEAERSEDIRHETMRRLRAHPGLVLHLIPAKLAFLLVPFDWELFPHPPDRQRQMNLSYLAVMLLALPGLWALWRRPAALGRWLLWTLPVCVLVQAVLFYGSPRFRLPAEPIALLLAATGIVYLMQLARPAAPPIRA